MGTFCGKNHYKSSARIIDGTLVLSLPDAVTPVVWRMETADVRASAIEVRERDGLFVLVLKTPRGDVNDIAAYAVRPAAVHVLMAITRAMTQAGTLRPGSPCLPLVNENSRPSTTFRTVEPRQAWLWALAFIAVAACLYLVTSWRQSVTPDLIRGENLSSEIIAGGDGSPTGMPVSADDYLNGF